VGVMKCSSELFETGREKIIQIKQTEKVLVYYDWRTSGCV